MVASFKSKEGTGEGCFHIVRPKKIKKKKKKRQGWRGPQACSFWNGEAVTPESTTKVSRLAKVSKLGCENRTAGRALSGEMPRSTLQSVKGKVKPE